MEDAKARVILSVALRRPGTLELAELRDGTLAVFKDGTPIDSNRFQTGEVEKSVAAFLKTRRLLDQASNAPAPAGT